MRFGLLTSASMDKKLTDKCRRSPDIPVFVESLSPMLALTTAVPNCSQNGSSESRKKTFDEPEDVDDAADQQGEHEVLGGEVSHESPSTLLSRLLLNSLDIRKFSISVSR